MREETRIFIFTSGFNCVPTIYEFLKRPKNSLNVTAILGAKSLQA